MQVLEVENVTGSLVLYVKPPWLVLEVIGTRDSFGGKVEARDIFGRD